MLLLLLACTAPQKESEPPAKESVEAVFEGLDTWSAATPLGTGRDHHVSFVDQTGGDFLYVMGGSSGHSAVSGIERSPIAADGSLSGFERLDLMPEALLGMGLCGGDGRYVIAGGLDGTSNSTKSVYIIHVQSDGSLTLEEAPSLGMDRYHLTLACVGEWVFAMGGLQQRYDGGAPEQTVATVVERSRWEGDGLAAWETVGDLPAPRTHQAVAVLDQAIYLLGGGEGASATTTIWRSEVGEDGSPGAWTEVGTLPEARATSAAFFRGGKLYVVAGMKTLVGQEVATVLRGSLQADGSLSDWDEQSSLPMARAHSHQAPIFGSTLYSLGGSIDHIVQADVYQTEFVAE
ncbi:MAG TPA: hypothetical protein PKW90_23180 [Myxococcota bacterium]|nr:hypothetical protein [Myxococcota bacterium]